MKIKNNARVSKIYLYTSCILHKKFMAKRNFALNFRKTRICQFRGIYYLQRINYKRTCLIIAFIFS